MQASDIMTAKVVTVGVDTDVEVIARLLLERRISAVPVVDSSDHILGIVSEGDLIRRPETETERHRSWWLRLLADKTERAEEYVTSHGRRADQVMTRDVVTVTEDSNVGEIAELLEQRRIKRVPVVRDGKLVGIVSRANLLQGLAARKEKIEAPSTDDRSIRDRVMAVLNQQDWVSHGGLNAIVNDGVVELWGWAESQKERDALRLATESVEGVREVKDRLGKLAPWVWGA